jgi:Rne/Rng family ribonuclease
MNKELFVSSTPHETKVGLVEDDLLAEVYLERENEYTLAGSIYKGRVTRVLPGMQSAFVDIGLERDAFLYVSDFMDLEEHDEDLTESVPANRGVQDVRPQGESESSPAPVDGMPTGPAHSSFSRGQAESSQETAEGQGSMGSLTNEPSGGKESQERDRGGWRGRRRRRGRREGRDYRAMPVAESTPGRVQESNRSQFGPPAGYQPIILPGESISKYRGMASPAAEVAPAGEEPVQEQAERPRTEAGSLEREAPMAATFPEDEPMFSNAVAPAETPVPEPHASVAEEIAPVTELPRESATLSVDWSPEFHRMDSAKAVAAAAAPETVREIQEVIETESFPGTQPPVERILPFAAPGTVEEETIDEEEVDAVRYEQSSDDGYDEFEEETHAAGQSNGGQRVLSDVRETVEEIHMNSFAESGAAPAGAVAAESDEDAEDFELEEAQAEAEAMLDAEARGNGAVDVETRAEVRASAGTAGYTQRAPRPRPGWERRGGGRRGGRRFPRRQSQEVPKISDLLKEGQEILVQIAKEPIGKKGARITSHIALPGRFLVYMPTVNHTGVSRKIASDEERQRLKRIVMSERENGHGGFIVRTAAQNASEDELRADIRFLKGLWNDIKTRAENSKPPALIYHDLNVVERVLRDQVTSDFSVIWVDTEAEYERILRFFNRFQPGLVKRVKLYTKETPLFEQFGLAEEMNKALKSKVWLKSGGYIVINQTEALVAIDINTGKYVGKTARLEDTIVKTNVDAVKEIVRQVRLRDLGGIIIIDFIDMDERRNRQRVMQALEEELRYDRAPSKVLQFNDFGLVAITRKRVKQSLERTIGAPCPYCQSTGYVKSVTTVANEIYVEMRKIAKHLEHEDVMLRVHPDVAKELKANNGRLLNEMEELTKRTIIVKSDPALHQEQFDIN